MLFEGRQRHWVRDDGVEQREPVAGKDRISNVNSGDSFAMGRGSIVI